MAPPGHPAGSTALHGCCRVTQGTAQYRGMWAVPWHHGGTALPGLPAGARCRAGPCCCDIIRPPTDCTHILPLRLSALHALTLPARPAPCPLHVPTPCVATMSGVAGRRSGHSPGTGLWPPNGRSGTQDSPAGPHNQGSPPRSMLFFGVPPKCYSRCALQCSSVCPPNAPPRCASNGAPGAPVTLCPSAPVPQSPWCHRRVAGPPRYTAAGTALEPVGGTQGHRRGWAPRGSRRGAG